MIQSNKKLHSNKRGKLWWMLIPLIVFPALVAWFLVPRITFQLTDGTESYTGAKLEAARLAIERSRELDHHYPGRHFARARVVEIKAPSTALEGLKAQGIACNDSPDSVDYYDVYVIRYWGIIKYEDEAERFFGCQLTRF